MRDRRKKAVIERKIEGKNGEKEGGMSPEEMMKPKNACQKEKESKRWWEGEKRQIVSGLTANEEGRREGKMETEEEEV